MAFSGIESNGLAFILSPGTSEQIKPMNPSRLPKRTSVQEAQAQLTWYL
jgi:hypothetical protein